MSKKSLAALLKAARAEPENVARWLDVAYSQHGVRIDAIATLHEAIERNSENETARASLWSALAELHGDSQNWDECVAACDRALEISPQHHQALEMRAAAHLHSGNVAEATATLQRLLRLSPRDPLHRLKLATLLQIQDKTALAAREFERVLLSHPDAPFSDEASAALELLDNLQGQTILARASGDLDFRRAVEEDFDAALESSGFYLSENARESLRQTLADGRVTTDAPVRIH
ncbi:MAG TPA: tetratricopeptide repeat protein [Abditibacteriaceae bacterium]|jgi:tetratricopeptide (TPR) repeat protein